MNNENRYIVPEKNRIELGQYIKNARINYQIKSLSLNELADIVNVTTSVISNLENGKIQKINPFLLQDIATALKIDYKTLYRIIGFLKDKDDLTIEKTKVYDSLPIEYIEKKPFVILWEKNKKEIIDLSLISKAGIIELKKYIKYLKIDYREYSEFLKWKKEQKKQYFYSTWEKRYTERQEWNESSKYRIPYDEESVSELFEENGLRLSEKGKEFLKKYIFYFGEECINENLKDKNGNDLTGAKRLYKLGKIIRYIATHEFLDFS